MRLYKWILFLFAVVLSMQCKDPFNPKLNYSGAGYLVVEGFLNSGPGPTEIRLSRSLPLDDTAGVKSEVGARLQVENTNSPIADFSEIAPGVYTCPQLIVNPGDQYRLHIFTANGSEYYSDFVHPVQAPPIDSISWDWQRQKGVEIGIHTHDPNNATHYYTWRFEETWEINASFIPLIRFVYSGGFAVGSEYINPDHSPDYSGFRCWQYDHSKNILTGSSIKLSEDVIHAPIQIIPNNSVRLSVLYYIKVFQHGLSQKGYDFMQRMKKNTEETGSIFDAQPSQLNSNIHNAFDPKEPVFGFVDMSNQDSAVLFIPHGDVLDWGYRPGCVDFPIYPKDDPDTLRKYGALKAIEYTTVDRFDAISVASPPCVDCRLSGSSLKPIYWPN